MSSWEVTAVVVEGRLEQTSKCTTYWKAGNGFKKHVKSKINACGWAGLLMGMKDAVRDGIVSRILPSFLSCNVILWNGES